MTEKEKCKFKIIMALVLSNVILNGFNCLFITFRLLSRLFTINKVSNCFKVDWFMFIIFTIEKRVMEET